MQKNRLSNIIFAAMLVGAFTITAFGQSGPTDDDVDRGAAIAAANGATPPTIDRGSTTPISTAQGYVFPRSLDEVEEAGSDTFVGAWQSHDASVDLYLLAEAVQHRQATERMADALEQLVASGITVNVTVEGSGGGEAPDMTGVANSIEGVGDALREAFGVPKPDPAP